jgi:anti-anti-sigma factor
MGYGIHREGRVVGESKACTHCKGGGVARAGTGSAEVSFCPRCGGSGVEPGLFGESVLWPQKGMGGQGVDGRVRGGSDAQLVCRYARRNEVGIVHASGEIDLHNVHRLAEMLDQALSNNRTVIVNFAEVSYIDSTGLNMLMRRHERCAQRNITMVVVFTSRHLWRIFSVLSLEDVFRIFPSVDAALQVLSRLDGSGRPSARGKQANTFIGRLV